MQESTEQRCGLLPADAQAPKVLEPGDGALDGPRSRQALQRAAILRDVLGSAIRAVRRNQLHAALGQVGVQRVAVEGRVADDARRRFARQHEVEQPLHQAAFVPLGRGGIDRHGQAAGIHLDHDFHAFSDFSVADPVSPAAGLAEGRVDEALVHAVLPALLDAAAGRTHHPLEEPSTHQFLEPAVHRALAAEFARQVFPLRTVVQHPEDAAQRSDLDRLIAEEAFKIAQEAFKKVTEAQRALIQRWFREFVDKGLKGIPEGITKETLEAYLRLIRANELRGNINDRVRERIRRIEEALREAGGCK